MRVHKTSAVYLLMYSEKCSYLKQEKCLNILLSKFRELPKLLTRVYFVHIRQQVQIMV